MSVFGAQVDLTWVKQGLFGLRVWCQLSCIHHHRSSHGGNTSLEASRRLIVDFSLTLHNFRTFWRLAGFEGAHEGVYPPQCGDPFLFGDSGQSVKYVAIAPPLVDREAADTQRLVEKWNKQTIRPPNRPSYRPSAVILISATSAGVPTKAPVAPAVIPIRACRINKHFESRQRVKQVRGISNAFWPSWWSPAAGRRCLSSSQTG